MKTQIKKQKHMNKHISVVKLGNDMVFMVPGTKIHFNALPADLVNHLEKIHIHRDDAVFDQGWSSIDAVGQSFLGLNRIFPERITDKRKYLQARLLKVGDEIVLQDKQKDTTIQAIQNLVNDRTPADHDGNKILNLL